MFISISVSMIVDNTAIMCEQLWTEQDYIATVCKDLINHMNGGIFLQ